MPMMANVPVPGWKQDLRLDSRSEAKTEASPRHSKRVIQEAEDVKAWWVAEAKTEASPPHPKRISQEAEDAAWAKSTASRPRSKGSKQQLRGSSSTSGYGSSSNPIGSPIGGPATAVKVASSPWPNSGPPCKRTAVEDNPEAPEVEHEPKRMKIRVDSSSCEAVYLAGNTAPWDTKTVTDVLHSTPKFHARAIWLIVESSLGPYDAYGKSWFRPATQLSDLLEEQLMQGIGLQTCTLTYPQNDGGSTIHYFEHDLKGDRWMQRRYYDPEHKQFRSQKQIMRVLVGI